MAKLLLPRPFLEHDQQMGPDATGTQPPGEQDELFDEALAIVTDMRPGLGPWVSGARDAGDLSVNDMPHNPFFPANRGCSGIAYAANWA